MLSLAPRRAFGQSGKVLRMMSATPRAPSKTSHIERTAAEPRDNSLHKVILSRLDRVNDEVRLFRLSIPEGCPAIKFLPGQWLDVHVPGLHKAGGFTITSTPADALPSSKRSEQEGDSRGYVELAVQKSPTNPPAAWLWRPVSEILNQELEVRVGGSFVWPPPGVDISDLRHIVLIAGGVGINPLMSILSHLAQILDLPYDIRFHYTLRDPGAPRRAEEILFLRRVAQIFQSQKVRGGLSLYLTPGGGNIIGEEAKYIDSASGQIKYQARRMTKNDVVEALGLMNERQNTVCYICGVPNMTDEFVEVAQKAEGMDPRTVLFERWW